MSTQGDISQLALASKLYYKRERELAEINLKIATYAEKMSNFDDVSQFYCLASS